MAAMFASSCATEAPKKDMGIQLYSLRELIGNPESYAQNHEAVLQQIADLGYTAVEAACYSDGLLYGVAPEQFKADCEAAGLEPISSHVVRYLSDEEIANHDFTAALEWWKEAVAAHKAAGMSYMVAPSINIPGTLAGLKTVCDYMNEMGAICKESGIKFGYHSHSHEFNQVEGQVAYDFMVENTDPDLVFFQMDVYWAVYGRVSPVEYFNKYPGRFELLHIKDHYEVGQSGMVGYDAIFRNFDVAGTKAYIVEMEGSGVGDILETCRISADYLRNSEFVEESYR